MSKRPALVLVLAVAAAGALLWALTEAGTRTEGTTDTAAVGDTDPASLRGAEGASHVRPTVESEPAPIPEVGHEGTTVTTVIRIRSPQGRPVPGARVRLMRAGHVEAEGTADEDGVVRLTVTQGTYDVHGVTPDGEVLARSRHVVSDGAEAPLDLGIGDGIPLRVRVLSEGSPVAGALVRAYRRAPRKMGIMRGRPEGRPLAESQTDTGGNVILAAMPVGPAEVWVDLEDGRSAYAFHDHAGPALRIFAFPKNVAVRGIVVAEGAEGLASPVAGAQVRIRGTLDDASYLRSTTSAADGTWRMNVPSAHVAGVSALADGCVPFPAGLGSDAFQRAQHRPAQQLSMLRIGWVKGDLRIVLRRCGDPAARIRVVGEDGTPRPKARVLVSICNASRCAPRAYVADDAGVVVFPHLRLGTHYWARLDASLERGSVTLALPEDGHETLEVELVASPALHLRGRVVGEDGLPVAGARIWQGRFPTKAISVWDPPAPEWFTGTDGRFEIGVHRRHSTIILNASKGDRRAGPFFTSARRQGPEGVVLALKPATRLVIRVVDRETGAPVRDALVRLEPVGFPNGRFERVDKLDRDGQLVLPATHLSKWRVRASQRNHLEAQWQELDLEDASPRTEIVCVLDPGLAITGRVVEATGVGVAAKVTVSRDGVRKTWTARTADDGLFRVTGLSNGLHQVRAGGPGLGFAQVKDVEPGSDVLLPLE